MNIYQFFAYPTLKCIKIGLKATVNKTSKRHQQRSTNKPVRPTDEKSNIKFGEKIHLHI